MKTVEEMSDRELLEFIFGAQSILMRKINRIEAHLEKSNFEEYLDGESRHNDQVYDELKGQVENLLNQINIREEE